MYEYVCACMHMCTWIRMCACGCDCTCSSILPTFVLLIATKLLLRKAAGGTSSSLRFAVYIETSSGSQVSTIHIIFVILWSWTYVYRCQDWTIVCTSNTHFKHYTCRWWLGWMYMYVSSPITRSMAIMCIFVSNATNMVQWTSITYTCSICISLAYVAT